MYDLISEPKTFAEASRQSKCLERAVAMAAKGYTAKPFATSDKAYYVDGGTKGYIVYLTEGVHCTCPDFERHGDVCKHAFFVLKVITQ
jgi:hypothetical protein